MVILMC